MAFHLYRHFDKDDNLLYVGVSLSTIYRLGQHKEHSHWFNSIAKVTIENFSTREASLTAETEAILKEKPRHNIMKTKADLLSITRRDGLDAAQRSASNLVRQVTFRPMYTISDVAKCLDVSNSYVRKLIAARRLGAFDLGEPGKPKMFVTGWQLIDFLECAQLGKLKEAA